MHQISLQVRPSSTSRVSIRIGRPMLRAEHVAKPCFGHGDRDVTGPSRGIG